MRLTLLLETNLVLGQMHGCSSLCLEKKADQTKLSWKAKDKMILKRESKSSPDSPLAFHIYSFSFEAEPILLPMSLFNSSSLFNYHVKANYAPTTFLIILSINRKHSFFKVRSLTFKSRLYSNIESSKNKNICHILQHGHEFSINFEFFLYFLCRLL